MGGFSERVVTRAAASSKIHIVTALWYTERHERNGLLSTYGSWMREALGVTE